MENRLNISTGTRWEEQVGYSRAVRVGNVIEVAGTTAVDDNGQTVAVGDPAAQARFILTKIRKVLEEAGAELDDVVRTRMYVTDIRQWQAIGQVHGEFFKNIQPVTTMLEVKALISPDLLVEIEATAVRSK